MTRSSSWFSSTLFPGSALTEQQATLLAVLHAGVRDSVELAPLIRALSYEYPGNYFYKLRRLARLIDQGVPWVDALEQTPGALTADMVLALRVGQHSGIVQATFEQLRQESSEQLLGREKAHWRSYLAYWLTVSLVMLVLFSFFNYFITPTLRKMMLEFDMASGARNLEIVSLYAMLPLYIAFAITCLGILFNWSESFRSWLIGRLRIPMESMTRKQSLILRILANSTEHGRPMAGTLSTLAKYHWDSGIRKKLLIARNEIEHGAQDWVAIQSVGLISDPQREALLGQTNQDQAWVLRSLAKNLSAHEQYRWGWSQSMIHPLMLIAFGLAVLGICWSVLDGLYMLVTELAKETGWR